MTFKPTIDRSVWLISWLLSNIIITLYNKYMTQFYPFSFPWLLTAIQMFVTVSCLCLGHFLKLIKLHKITALHEILFFSLLYTANIFLSTYSLSLVSVSVHQGIRALGPFITILINLFYSQEQVSEELMLRILPIVIGVIFTTTGDYYFSLFGTLTCLFATWVSCLKGVLTHKLQKSFGTLDLLLYNSFFAFIITLSASLSTGEFKKVYARLDSRSSMLLLCNGIIAFIVNITSFVSNKKTSALTMSIAGNIKLVTTVLLSFMLFSSSLGIINGIGIGLTFLGGIGYTVYKNKPILPVNNSLRN